ncbi:SRPBCC family protein [Dyella choica]|uniref:Vanillate O-demethylase oxidoreductase VanB n=1 Tax=Dyella choica TaxID=1927959 RepID=A0A3S0RI69_9GAMM|nr:SRPBCC family protein [Dyella choica]RUL71099.1 vanillate O-demethylase oxidoreductase VanB [Dyella choica]
MNSSTDRIERQVLIKAPRAKVWQALADAESFGEWFGVALKGKRFVAGEPCEGNITYPGYEHLVMKVVVDRVEPERLLSFRWHPYAIDPDVDYSQEPTTLVTFELEESSGGTLLRVVESGFDRIPAHRRQEAFRMNNSGWEEQMNNIDAYVASH